MGLMTGDVTINPSASCLVMTTEVRSKVKGESRKYRIKDGIPLWLHGIDGWEVHIFMSPARRHLLVE